MSLEKNKKNIIVFAILEGKNASTEIRFFEKFINLIKCYYKKISFISPFSINGNNKIKKNFVVSFLKKLKSNIKITIQKEINSNDNIHIFCIWDTTKQKSNFQNNYEALKKIKRIVKI